MATDIDQLIAEAACLQTCIPPGLVPYQILTATRGINISGQFTPPQPLNQVLWLRPESLSGLTNNDPVDPWPDDSGNANNFIAENSAFRPIYNTNQIGGRPAVTFDGVDDFLSKGSNLGVTTAWTLFVVLRFDSAIPASGREWVFKNGEGAGWGVAKWDGNRNGFFTSSGTFLNDGACTTNPEMWSYVRTSAPLAKLFVNGVNVALTNSTGTGTAPDANSRLGIFLNSTSPFKGKMSEVMLWNVALSDADRQTVENYLITKYGL